MFWSPEDGVSEVPKSISLEEMAACVTRSSPVQGVNIPQLVGDEAGNIFVPLYDWQGFLSPFFKALGGIKKQQHLR